MRLSLTTVFVFLSTLQACGAAPLAARLAATSGVTPPPASHDDYFLSTDCSPHSLNITLSLSESGMKMRETTGSYGAKVIQLIYQSRAITSTVVYSGYGGTQTTQAVATPVDQGYPEAVAGLALDAERIQTGNVCFPARPELAPVVAYINSLKQP